MRIWPALAITLLLVGCGRLIPAVSPPLTTTPPAAPPSAPAVSSAAMAGVSLGPSPVMLNYSGEDARTALSSFIESCPQLLSREDVSGLTRNADWQPACSAARTWEPAQASDFFRTQFEAVEVGDGSAFATGYFEPEILGSRTRSERFNTPVYAMPATMRTATSSPITSAPRSRMARSRVRCRRSPGRRTR